MTALRKLLSPETCDELASIERELIALDPWYRLAPEMLAQHAVLVLLDRRTHSRAA